jgi:hypothetical protein
MKKMKPPWKTVLISPPIKEIDEVAAFTGILTTN